VGTDKQNILVLVYLTSVYIVFSVCLSAIWRIKMFIMMVI